MNETSPQNGSEFIIIGVTGAMYTSELNVMLSECLPDFFIYRNVYLQSILARAT